MTKEESESKTPEDLADFLFEKTVLHRKCVWGWGGGLLAHLVRLGRLLPCGKFDDDDVPVVASPDILLSV